MTQAFDFFDQAALPSPRISPAEAARFVRDRYGVDGTATELGSQQDANFLIETPAGLRFVLKVSNPAFTVADLAAQDAAAAHIAQCEPDLHVPVGLPGGDGTSVQTVEVDGRPAAARLVTYVDGDVLSANGYLAPSVVGALGELAGRTSRALASFDGSVPTRELQWDLQHAEEVVERLAEYVSVPGGAEAARAAAAAAGRALDAVRDRLPVQVIHGDLTDDNVVAVPGADGRSEPIGVIDFGDLMQSWAIAEAAVTCSSVLQYANGPAAILPAIRAYDRIRPISDDELQALWPLVVLRAASLMVSGHHQAAIDPGNKYAAGNLTREWCIFEQATSVPLEVMTGLIRTAIRAGAPTPALTGHPLLAAGTKPVRLDLSTTSPELHNGAFLGDQAELKPAASVLARTGGSVAYVPFLQPRLTRTQLNSYDAPETAALGIDLFAQESLELRAPWDAIVEQRGDSVGLHAADGLTLWLSGPQLKPAPGVAVEAGAVFGRLEHADDVSTLRLQVTRKTAGGGLLPFFVTPELAEGWAVVCPDPTGLVDPEYGGEPVEDDLLARRESAFATVQEHYYEAPPQIERGWRQHLFDTEGRAYLDMVNNVAILGHGHPRLCDAVDQQWRLLNTNSRFHYEAVVEFSERLAATLPEPLDTVFLVNSGTEAVDLALRLAWANTGRRDVVTLREAYHGWSDATDAVSTSVADNPNALESRPPWVHPVAAPNSYRGQYRGDEAFRYAEDAVKAIASGPPPAAFLSESYYGNAGGMALPDRYLDHIYQATREAGGLCIADEVQVGYGRLGNWFWGFEQQNVVPDIVTVAKAMGNGHPLGAVITTRAIADGYRSQGYFFSSAGGSPVSSIVGLTVLDVLRDEELQQNARVVGDHLRQRLVELSERHPIIGAVHGHGLYLGAELVRNRETREPAAAETAAICERMRELGVIMQPTSDRLCVLKIKPPLGITTADADYFADTLDQVLTEGW
ncbi:aminotransferase [Kribbella sp. NBC_00709]|uniref:aminotransferase n=1 Tax=Kribbella sp. NBC_00709 TaxID=2975972 RepID=UPI002E2CA350|nr:aminotransferase [Kribbella sp. NBC_00709]